MLCPISCLSLQKDRGGEVLMPMTLSSLIKFLSRSWFDFPLQSWIYNSEMTTWHFFVIKQPLYICLLFRLPLRIILLIYGKYIVHLPRQWERVVICTKNMCIHVYIIRKNMYITLHNFLFIPFSVPFRFPFRGLVRPNGHQCRTNRSNF